MAPVTVGLALIDAADSNPASPWPSAIFGLVGVVVGGVLLAVSTAYREQTARRAESQKTALYELQDAALTLRKALRKYDALRPTKKQTDAMDDAIGKVEILRVRILCDTVRESVENWQPLAEKYYTGADTVTFAQEDAAWRRFQKDVGIELRRFT